MTRQEAHALAAHKARYTHRPWIAFVGRDGIAHAVQETAASVKSAMLACGTQGRWTAYSGERDGPVTIRDKLSVDNTRAPRYLITISNGQ